MKYFREFLSIFFLFILSCFPGNAPGRDYVEGEVLVRFKEHVKNVHDKETVRLRNLSVRRKFNVVKNLYHFSIPPGTDVIQTVQELSSDPDILSAEPNYIYSALIVPNDEFFENQWGMSIINAPPAWDKGTDSSGVVIAVIDSGVDYNHPDLSDNIWKDSQNNPGYNAIKNDNDPMDQHSHGTHCAGVIGAMGNNEIGVCGVNWQVKIMVLKFLDAYGNGTLADAIRCIEYVADRYDEGVNIAAVSNSWGGNSYSLLLYNAIDELRTRNVLFVAAAGNNARDADAMPIYPAAFNLPNIISVASSEQDDDVSTFSNYGKISVDIAAPGTSIYSTVLSTNPKSIYDIKSGTSMATPFVAGAAGLLSAMMDVSDSAQLKEWILRGADRLHQWTNLTMTGGRLNLAESLRIAGLPPEVQPVTGFTAAREAGTGYVNLSWNFPSGAQGVVIRRGMSSYPARWDEGTGIYDGTGTSFPDTTASPGTAYYYSCWAHYILDAGVQEAGEDNASAAAYAYTNSPPLKPDCVLPSDGAVDVELPLLLTATGFYDPDNDAHRASRWQVSTDEAFRFPSVDRTTAGTTNTTLNAGSLASNTTYYWRVQYQDASNDWSEWSNSSDFTTESASSEGGGGGGGGCFVATAAFGSPFEAHVRVFREFRDKRLLTNRAGRILVRWYYRHSPEYAAVISRNRMLRAAARTALMPLYVFARFFL